MVLVLADVDVERPVVKFEGLCQDRLDLRLGLLVRGGLDSTTSTRGEQARNRQSCPAGRGAAQELLAGGEVGHQSSGVSTTNVDSGLQLRVRRSPTLIALAYGRALRT